MKIAINTIIDNRNYGNRLQNYALQTTLEKLGHEVATIDRSKIARPRKFGKINAWLSDNTFSFSVARLLKGGSKQTNADKILTKPDLNEFSKENIHFITANNQYELINREYDCVVTGSDQVWNYNFWEGPKIEFAKPAKVKKIAYAASVGVDTIPNSLTKAFSEGLKDYSGVTVREAQAAEALAPILGQKPEVVLDPTLLLTKADWLELKTANPVDSTAKEPYVFVFFLSPVFRETDDEIQTFAKDKGLKVIYIYEELQDHNVDLGEFLNLLDGASFVFTDSFHGSVFSILFEKAFKTVNRNKEVSVTDMNSRLVNLFSLFDIKNNGVALDEKDQYKEITKLVNEKRAASKGELEKMLADQDYRRQFFFYLGTKN